MSVFNVAVIALPTVFMIAWLVQTQTKNAGWVDVLWAFGVGILGVAYGYAGSGDLDLRVIIMTLYCVWFTRLGLHLFKRVHNAPEDGRYQAFRAWAKPNEHVVFAIFYLVQGSWVWLFTLPAWVISSAEFPPIWALVIGLVIVTIAFVGESLADYQLKSFVEKPANKGITCDHGLWRYSRHPNYFFEWLHWFAYPFLGWNAEFGTFLWLAPIIAFVFLYFVTGIPFTEQQALRSRGESYRRYQERTSPFIPWRTKQ